MASRKKSLEVLERRFERRLSSFDETCLPAENVRERRKGSLSFGRCRLFLWLRKRFQPPSLGPGNYGAQPDTMAMPQQIARKRACPSTNSP